MTSKHSIIKEKQDKIYRAMISYSCVMAIVAFLLLLFFRENLFLESNELLVLALVNGTISAFIGSCLSWLYFKPSLSVDYILVGIVAAILSHLICIIFLVLFFVFSVIGDLFSEPLWALNNVYTMTFASVFLNLMIAVFSVPCTVVVSLIYAALQTIFTKKNISG